MQVDAASEQQSQGASTLDEFKHHAELAQGFLSANKPQEAIPELQAASAINSDHVEVEADLGVLLFYAGRLREAIPHLRKAVALQADLARVQSLLGIAESRTGEMQAARSDLSAAFPKVDEAPVKLTTGLELLSLESQSGQLDKAAQILPELRQIAPTDARVLFAAYNTYADLTRESILALALAAPDSAQLQQAMAHELIREGRPEQAIAHYKEALRIDPNIPGGHFELAEVLGQAEDQTTRNQAESEYDKALKDNPEDEKSLWRKAQIEAKRGDNQQALELLRSAVALQPSDAEAQCDLAKTLMNLGRDAEARHILEQTVGADPTNVTVHYRLAMLYRRTGHAEEARHEIDLYKHYRELKEKLRDTLKELMITPGGDPSDSELEQR